MSPTTVTAPVTTTTTTPTVTAPDPTLAAETAALALTLAATDYVIAARKGEASIAGRIRTTGVALAGGAKQANLAKAVFAEFERVAANDATFTHGTAKTVANVISQESKAYGFANVIGLTSNDSVLVNALKISTGRVKSQDDDQTHAEFLTAEFDRFAAQTVDMTTNESTAGFAAFVARMLAPVESTPTEPTEPPTDETEPTEPTEGPATPEEISAGLVRSVAQIAESLELLAPEFRAPVLAALAAVLAAN